MVRVEQTRGSGSHRAAKIEVKWGYHLANIVRVTITLLCGKLNNSSTVTLPLS